MTLALPRRNPAPERGFLPEKNPPGVSMTRNKNGWSLPLYFKRDPKNKWLVITPFFGAMTPFFISGHGDSRWAACCPRLLGQMRTATTKPTTTREQLEEPADFSLRTKKTSQTPKSTHTQSCRSLRLERCQPIRPRGVARGGFEPLRGGINR